MQVGASAKEAAGAAQAAGKAFRDAVARGAPASVAKLAAKAAQESTVFGRASAAQQIAASVVSSCQSALNAGLPSDAIPLIAKGSAKMAEAGASAAQIDRSLGAVVRAFSAAARDSLPHQASLQAAEAAAQSLEDGGSSRVADAIATRVASVWQASMKQHIPEHVTQIALASVEALAVGTSAGQVKVVTNQIFEAYKSATAVFGERPGTNVVAVAVAKAVAHASSEKAHQVKTAAVEAAQALMKHKLSKEAIANGISNLGEAVASGMPLQQASATSFASAETFSELVSSGIPAQLAKQVAKAKFRSPANADAQSAVTVHSYKAAIKMGLTAQAAILAAKSALKAVSSGVSEAAAMALAKAVSETARAEAKAGVSDEAMEQAMAETATAMLQGQSSKRAKQIGAAASKAFESAIKSGQPKSVAVLSGSVAAAMCQAGKASMASNAAARAATALQEAMQEGLDANLAQAVIRTALDTGESAEAAAHKVTALGKAFKSVVASASIAAAKVGAEVAQTLLFSGMLANKIKRSAKAAASAYEKALKSGLPLAEAKKVANLAGSEVVNGKSDREVEAMIKTIAHAYSVAQAASKGLPQAASHALKAVRAALKAGASVDAAQKVAQKLQRP
jgi:colicin import membrane protein